MFNLGPTELIIILVIVLIVFGVGRLPEIGGALGKSIREFRQASTDADKKAKEEVKDGADDKPVV
jgi:sec-independent protein translocase protein TatA